MNKEMLESILCGIFILCIIFICFLTMILYFSLVNSVYRDKDIDSYLFLKLYKILIIILLADLMLITIL